MQESLIGVAAHTSGSRMLNPKVYMDYLTMAANSLRTGHGFRRLGLPTCINLYGRRIISTFQHLVLSTVINHGPKVKGSGFGGLIHPNLENCHPLQSELIMCLRKVTDLATGTMVLNPRSHYQLDFVRTPTHTAQSKAFMLEWA
jgi:hypothetical protein